MEHIYIDGNAYDKGELLAALRYYRTNYIPPVDINQDIYKEILLNATPNNILQLCLADKHSNALCNSKAFWEEKFNREGLPHLVIMDTVVFFRNSPYNQPKNAKEWISVYINMKNAYILADKLVNHILAHEKFNFFNVYIHTAFDSNWMPEQFKNVTGDVDFIITPKEFIISKDNILSISLTKEDMIHNIAKLIYYVDSFELEEFDPEDEDYEGFSISKKQLMNPTYMKRIFPTW